MVIRKRNFVSKEISSNSIIFQIYLKVVMMSALN